MNPTVEQTAETTFQARHELASSNAGGQAEAMKSMLDPLEQAIESTARIMRDEREEGAVMMHTMVGDVPLSDLYRRMSAHLDALLAIQIKQVTADEKV